ncbi:MAG TPA: hypothetical protein VEP49_04410 [Acidimicrobiia bacterium]|nr:hypothetical protein [Acidimicrobiia bacterium]
MSAEGQSVVSKAQPVPAAPPGVGDVVRHGASVGLGALGLARRAAGTLLGRMQASARPPTPPGTVDLVPGAVAGVAIVVERRVRVVVAAIVASASNTVRVAGRPVAVQRAWRPLEDWIWAMNEVARREQAHNRAEAAAMMPVLIQRITENVLAQLDLPRLVSQIPVDDIVAEVDLEAIVQRIDLGGVIRESTAGVGAEAIDALRSQGVALDAFTAKLVDKLLFRRAPRQLEVK